VRHLKGPVGGFIILKTWLLCCECFPSVIIFPPLSCIYSFLLRIFTKTSHIIQNEFISNRQGGPPPSRYLQGVGNFKRQSSLSGMADNSSSTKQPQLQSILRTHRSRSRRDERLYCSTHLVRILILQLFIFTPRFFPDLKVTYSPTGRESTPNL
jgi:hypothetical protein